MGAYFSLCKWGPWPVAWERLKLMIIQLARFLSVAMQIEKL